MWLITEWKINVWPYVLRRTLLAVPTFFIATAATFFIMSEAVDDPRESLVSCGTSCDQSTYDSIVDEYNLDEPVLQRYVRWLESAAFGDFGPALSQGDKPVTDVIRGPLVNTMWLAVPAMLVATAISVGLAIVSVIRPGSIIDRFGSAVGFWGLVVPPFLTGLFLQTVVVVVANRWNIKIFWTQGLHADSVGQIISSAALPVFALASSRVTRQYLLAKSSMQQVKNEPYINAARARGLPNRRLVCRHILRPVMGSLLAIWAFEFAAILGGTVVIEFVFSWPGVGRLFLNATTGSDINLVMALATLFTVGAFLANFLADIFHGMVDPRVSHE